MHVIRVMDARQGDVVTEFPGPEVKTKQADKQRDVAREVFDAAMGRGMQVFAIDEKNMGTQLKTFDPEVKAMLAIPQVVGG